MRAPIAFVLLVLGTQACKPRKPEEEAKPAPAASGPSELADLGRKQNGYVVCLNGFSDDVRKGRALWLEQFGEKGPGVDEKRENLSGPPKLNNLTFRGDHHKHI